MEPVFIWTEKYSVGVEEIDYQHKKIFQFINELTLCLEQDESEGTVEDTIMSMIDYVVYHFNAEEKYLAKHVDLLEHRRQHDAFTEKVLSYQDAVVADPETVGSEAVAFLKQWLQEHILFLDKKYFNDLAKDTAAA